MMSVDAIIAEDMQTVGFAVDGEEPENIPTDDKRARLSLVEDE